MNILPPIPKQKRRNKYGNRKTTVRGITFDSEREARRYCELVMLEKSGEITALSTQVKFILAPSVKIKGKTKPALRYYADFTYRDKKGDLIIEDSKGHASDAYKIKRHLMMSEFGIEIREV